MTRQEQFDLLANEFAELIKAKNDKIQLLNWQVADLTARLEAAEAGKSKE